MYSAFFISIVKPFLFTLLGFLWHEPSNFNYHFYLILHFLFAINELCFIAFFDEEKAKLEIKLFGNKTRQLLIRKNKILSVDHDRETFQLSFPQRRNALKIQ